MLYTSGSTGFPKGVLQEYGIYDKLTKFCVLGVRGTLHEVSHEMARHIDALAECFEKNNLRYGGYTNEAAHFTEINGKKYFIGSD